VCEERAHGRGIKIFVIGVNDNPDRIDHWVIKERAGCPRKNSLTGKQAILFRAPTAGPDASTGGNDDGDSGFWFQAHSQLSSANILEMAGFSWRGLAFSESPDD